MIIGLLHVSTFELGQPLAAVRGTLAQVCTENKVRTARVVALRFFDFAFQPVDWGDFGGICNSFFYNFASSQPGWIFPLGFIPDFIYSGQTIKTRDLLVCYLIRGNSVGHTSGITRSWASPCPGPYPSSTSWPGVGRQARYRPGTRLVA